MVGSLQRPLLNELEEQVSISNQNLVQAAAQFRQARALVQSARSGYLPTVSANASVTRSQSPAGFVGQNQSLTTRGASTSYTVGSMPRGNWTCGAACAEPWSRIQRGAQASAADLDALRLSIQAELAQNYFQLRALDAQKHLFDDTIRRISAR
jgi:outer membrane protein TolC